MTYRRTENQVLMIMLLPGRATCTLSKCFFVVTECVGSSTLLVISEVIGSGKGLIFGNLDTNIARVTRLLPEYANYNVLPSGSVWRESGLAGRSTLCR